MTHYGTFSRRSMTSEQINTLRVISTELLLLGKLYAKVDPQERDDELASSLFTKGERIQEILNQ
ncbi:hypothetical protein [Paraglaciecola agarilytica]|uniref:hypothetical protein n=1 Tax=Paraglaciecola chathamensis TaxID=368405 RepID=UPI002353C337|nr:hypothetical protein [Paraglaciecola agarilytica]